MKLLRFRPLLRQRPQIHACTGRSFGEGIDDRRVGSSDISQHAQRLGTLAGEDECESGIGHRQSTVVQRSGRIISVNGTIRLYRRVCKLTKSKANAPAGSHRRALWTTRQLSSAAAPSPR